LKHLISYSRLLPKSARYEPHKGYLRVCYYPSEAVTTESPAIHGWEEVRYLSVPPGFRDPQGFEAPVTGSELLR